MEVNISDTKTQMGQAAAAHGAAAIQKAIAEKGKATIVVATGASQFEMLSALVVAEGIAWDKVTGFHLDEYVGLPMSHPASFRKYLKERFVEKVPGLAAFHYIDGEGDVTAECNRLGDLISKETLDVLFCGIGENGHLAFNDPPADFETTTPYLQVSLDEACRKQQMGEGWFPTLDDVPAQAVSMSVHQMMQARTIICTVPDERKAAATAQAIEGGVTPDVPASKLQEHDAAFLYLDPGAASKLSG